MNIGKLLGWFTLPLLLCAGTAACADDVIASREHTFAVETVVEGVAEGPLVGGNLVLLAATVGTFWALRTRGALLFFEEVGEATYRLDRLLTQLRLSGALDGVKGILVGALSECPDEGAPNTPALSDLLRDRLGDLGVPVARGFPFGHQPYNWTLPLGVRARLDATAGTVEILEPAVAPRALGES